MLNGGCWIFLSHSSHDIEKVRIVRNEFERLGHNPLAFHLKCLSTDTEEGRHELDSLIKREIDAREWFVFCESPEAAQSQYVREEHAYIINSGKDKVWTIDMTTDIDSILDKVRKICLDIEVFISYAHCDENLIQPLIDALINKDYSVWTPEGNLQPGDLWEKKISEAIIRCAYKGFLYCGYHSRKHQIIVCRERSCFCLLARSLDCSDCYRKSRITERYSTMDRQLQTYLCGSDRRRFCLGC